MADVDSEQVEEAALLNEAQMDRTELATELRKALGDDEPIKSINKGLMANHLALLEATGLDQRDDDDE